MLGSGVLIVSSYMNDLCALYRGATCSSLHSTMEGRIWAPSSWSFCMYAVADNCHDMGDTDFR
ncbi:hypothetical protein OS493_017664 [Desmophyllum pertusum]|uniref:Uncharacterized protein n=1 Tax=Desmophyllum pertusum TaxID=174260 RepID=A0A9X0CXH5_9CNID|nr:hypothetical protein OS493_017664 [Desmophyllum pertusum]